MRFKKLFIPVSLALSVITPVTLAVSCSKDSKNKVNLSNPKTFFNSPQGMVTIDISHSTPDGLVETLLNSLKVKMPNAAPAMAPKDKVNFDRLKSYVMASNFVNPVFRLKNGNDSYDIDFTEVGKRIEVVKNILKKYRFDANDMGDDNTPPNPKYLFSNHGQKATTIGAGAEGYQIISFSKVAISLKDNTDMISYMGVYDDDTLPVRPKQNVYKIHDDWGTYTSEITQEQYKYLQTAQPSDPLWNQVDTMGLVNHDSSSLSVTEEVPEPTADDYVHNSAYLKLLGEYHKVLWKFVNSPFYKKWVFSDARNFRVAVNDSPLGSASSHSDRGRMVVTSPGQLYDQPNSLKLSDSPTTYEKETSNLEFIWTVKLLNIEGYIK